MNDAEHFERVLEELGSLLGELGDLACHIVLIGGQVIALEARAGGDDGRIRVVTSTGVEIDRGFSFEPDLLCDVEAMGFQADRLPEVLRARGYVRVRDFRWRRTAEDGTAFDMDLFVPEASEASEAYVPTGMTRLASGDRAVVKTRRLQLTLRSGRTLEIEVPDPVAFLKTKVAAMDMRREAKDAFDVFCYVHRHGPAEIRKNIEAAGNEGLEVLTRLRRHFADSTSRGVQDVLEYASSLDEDTAALLARAVVDLFDALD